MAPIGESCYFPPLDRCLSGEHQLIAWKTAFIGLSQLDHNSDYSSLKKHLTDSHTLDLLVHSLSPTSTATSQTKSSFDTKTSAIHVSPSNDGQYDIKQIKDDALWLSKETAIDELAALRIAMLEWQMRSSVQLLEGNTVDEVAQPGIIPTDDSLRITRPSLRSSIRAQPLRAEAFDSIESRQKRLLKVYLSERQYIVKTTEFILASAQCQVSHTERKQPMEKAGDRFGWLKEIGKAILVDWNADGVSPKSGKNQIVIAVDALQARATDLEQGSGWFKDEGLQEDIEAAFANSLILEMIHIMEIVLVMLDSSTKITRTDAFLSWFRFMNRYSFFELFEPPFRELYPTYDLPVQSLVALVSLAILKLPIGLELLPQIPAASTAAPESNDDALYLLNSSAINEIHDIFIAAAEACPITASPAVLAWSIILQSLREYALLAKEKREIRQADRASDRIGTTESSDNEGAERSSDRRRLSTGSDTSQQLSFLEELLERVMLNAPEDDPIAFLARRAVDSNKVFNIITALAVDYCTPFGSEHSGQSGLRMRRVLLDLMRAVLGLIQYQPALLIASLAVLTGFERYWDTLERPIEFSTAEPASYFLEDHILMQNLFRTALSRFPYETLPFLKLCRSLAICNAKDDAGMPAIWSLIDDLDEITIQLPANFVAYKTIREDEEANYVELIDSLSFIGPDLVISRPSKRLHTSTKAGVFSDALELPSGTVGRILSETRPPVVMWHYEYSGLAYMGKILQLALGVGESWEENSNTPQSRETVAEIIDLISVMLCTTVKSGSENPGPLIGTTAADAARTILEKASDRLDRNQDIISVIFEIFDNELQRRHNVSEEDGSVEILVRCIQFTHALMPIMPDRVWPFLGRSGLLGVNEGENKISAVVASAEMVLGRYEFLLGCIRVFDSLVEDAVTHAVARKAPTKAITRFSSANTLGTGISQTAMKKVLLCFQRITIDTFESVKNWRFAAPEDRLEINTWICAILTKILKYSFAVDDDRSISNKLAEPLAPAAEYIVEVFLSTSTNDLSVHPLMEIIHDGRTTPETSLSTRSFQYWTSQVQAATTLVTVLIQVNRLLQHPPSYLDEQTFKASPTLAMVYAAHGSFRLPVAKLLSALIGSASTLHRQTPSLLGYLGQETASHFLEVVSMIDQLLCDEQLSIELWRLLSVIVSKQQQWLAHFVLTGNTPRDSLKGPQATARTIPRTKRSILNIALDGLSNIEKLQPQAAIAMLEFVTLAADFWPRVLVTIEQHSHFLTATLDYVGRLAPSSGPTKERSKDYGATQISSLILDIYAMYIHHARQSGDVSFAKKLLTIVSYISLNAVSTPSYNASLHGNLRQNFESKFPTCSLDNFKRTSLTRPLLGNSFYYDLNVATKMLSFDPAWIGRRNQGFGEELIRANLNLSLVEAQVNLLHSWKFLSIEMSRALDTDPKFQKLMAISVLNCLASSPDTSLPEAIFEGLAQARVELAFTLLQRLVEVKAPTSEVENILPTAWDTVRPHSTELGSALTGESAEYNRTLLKILYLTLRAHTSALSSSSPETLHVSGSNGSSVQHAATASAETLKTAIEVLGTIVARGFRSLTTALHDDHSRILPSDFGLVTAMLRTILSIPGIERHSTQLISQFADYQTARCASTLLSWADQLATNGDPIFGELSILFLLEMSSVPVLAETLAVDGLLTRISNTNLVQNLRQGQGVGPFHAPVRLFSIWSRGILPLYLNLLHAIGAPIAVEISTALNGFPGQLAHASSNFDGKASSSTDPAAGFITLGMVSEAETLAVISTVLDTFREAGASAGVIAADILVLGWDRVQVKDDIENWMQRRSALREKIVPTDEKEEAWARQQPLQAGSGADNLLEEKVVHEMIAVLTLLSGGDQ